METNATLEILMRAFPGRVLLRLPEAAPVIGMAEQTARNQLLIGTFPVATIKQGRQRLVHLKDLAKYIESLGKTEPAETAAHSPVPRRRPGRPTNAERAARQLAAATRSRT